MKVLSCTCHGVDKNGFVYSCLMQISKKGLWGIQTTRTDEWRRLKTTTTKRGYLQVDLHGKNIRVNRLIAMAFIKNPNNYPEVQHYDGIRTNNKIENLKWGTQKHNAMDRDRHGNTCRGIRNKNAKINDEIVRQIRRLRIGGQTLSSLAEKFNVSKKLILLVCQRKIWSHVL